MQDSPESAHSAILLNTFVQGFLCLIILSWSCDLVKWRNGKVPHAIMHVCAKHLFVPFLKLLYCLVFSPLDKLRGSEIMLYLCQLTSVKWYCSFSSPLLLQHKCSILNRSNMKRNIFNNCVSQQLPRRRAHGWILQRALDLNLKQRQQSTSWRQTQHMFWKGIFCETASK